MNKLKTLAAAVAVIMGANLSAACASNAGIGAKPVTRVQTETHALKNVGYETLLAPINGSDFAFKLGQGLIADVPETDNFVYSPLSVWLPLAALVNATEEEHKPALLDALGAAGATEQQINNYAQMFLYLMTGEANKEYADDYKSPLQIANALFVDKDQKVKQSFAQSFADNFLGTMFNVDFSSRQAVDAVNDWASEHTDGLITDVVDDFDPQTVAAIANAIYYSDRWNWEFNEDETKSDVFHAAAGDTTALYMKREGDSQLYYEDGRVQAMPLSFKNGGNLWVILPKDETANELYASMTAEYRVEIMGGCISSTGKLLLPKYEIASARAIDLKGALTALGVPLFDIEAAPLTDGLLESDTPAWIDTAMHKAVIKVDEKGTTAAAVTAMMVGGRGIPQPTGVFEMICDHPFVFVLEYGQILFTGVVNDPSETP